jgi:hypothetical protein
MAERAAGASTLATDDAWQAARSGAPVKPPRPTPSLGDAPGFLVHQK